MEIAVVEDMRVFLRCSDPTYEAWKSINRELEHHVPDSVPILPMRHGNPSPQVFQLLLSPVPILPMRHGNHG